MKMDELRELTGEELLAKLKHYRDALLDLRIQEYQGQMTTPSAIRHTKTIIARIRTLLRQRELGIETGAQSG